MEEKIVLDSKSFEALAVDNRVRILKSLKQRRKTLSEIAKEMDISVSGAKEHLQKLEQANLVEKKDDGHKWKYYELTKKGTGIVAPKELKVWILLGLSLIALVLSLMPLHNEVVNEKIAPTSSGMEKQDILDTDQTPLMPIITVISAITIALCLAILIGNRIWKR